MGRGLGRAGVKGIKKRKNVVKKIWKIWNSYDEETKKKINEQRRVRILP